MIPIFGFLETDSIGVLVMSYPEDTAKDLIKKVQDAAAIRVKSRPNMVLVYNNQRIDTKATVEEIGFKPLEHFFVVRDKKRNV